MRILMLGNSFVYTNDMPQIRTGLTGAEVVCHIRCGVRLSKPLNPKTKLGEGIGGGARAGRKEAIERGNTMKTAICYYSRHRGNTLKVLQAIYIAIIAVCA